MTVPRSSRRELHLKPAEELVPCIDWYDFLIKVAARCMKEVKVSIAEGGYQHHDIDFWRVLVFMCLKHLAITAGTNELNDLRYEREHGGRGRPSGRLRLHGTSGEKSAGGQNLCAGRRRSSGHTPSRHSRAGGSRCSRGNWKWDDGEPCGRPHRFRRRPRPRADGGHGGRAVVAVEEDPAHVRRRVTVPPRGGKRAAGSCRGKSRPWAPKRRG